MGEEKDIWDGIEMGRNEREERGLGEMLEEGRERDRRGKEGKERKGKRLR